MSEKKPRIIFKGEVQCPFCEKVSELTVEKETTVPGTPAETETYAKLSKSTQERLED